VYFGVTEIVGEFFFIVGVEYVGVGYAGGVYFGVTEIVGKLFLTVGDEYVGAEYTCGVFFGKLGITLSWVRGRELGIVCRLDWIVDEFVVVGVCVFPVFTNKK
jgi:hypothetical protein